MAKHNPNSPGAGVARNMMHVLADAVVKVRAALIPHENAEKWRYNTAQMETLEQELAPMMRQLYGQLQDTPGLDPGLQAFIDEMTGPHNQSTFLLQAIGLLGAAITAIPTLGQIVLREQVNHFNQLNADVPLDPSIAVDAFVKGILSQDDVNGWTSQSGIGPGVTGLMLSTAGEPPGPIDMINLWRWGRISEADLDEGLKFSRLAPQYVPIVKKLSYGNMSPADAVELAVKGIMSPADAQAQFVKAGGDPTQWDVLFLGAGDAPGNEQAIGLLNQGLISEADALRVFGRSRLNPEFYPIELLLRHKFLAPFQIHQVVANGGATVAQATQWMLNLGYGADQAAAVVNAAHATKTATVHQATEAMITEMYSEGIADEAVTVARLEALGYDAQTAQMIISLADAKLATAERKAATGVIKSEVLKGNITEAVASSALDALGYPAATRDGLLAGWEVEAALEIKTLSAAQIGKALKDGIFDYPTASARWVKMGYSQADADVMAAFQGAGPLYVAPPTATA